MRQVDYQGLQVPQRVLIHDQDPSVHEGEDSLLVPKPLVCIRLQCAAKLEVSTRMGAMKQNCVNQVQLQMQKLCCVKQGRYFRRLFDPDRGK